MVSAPRNDLILIKRLNKFAQINRKASDAAIKKIANHLWYISPELLPLALFDDELPSQDRQAIAAALTSDEIQDIDAEKKCSMSIQELLKLNIGHLAPTAAFKFFSVLKIDAEFLHKPVQIWPHDKAYLHGKAIVESLHAINDYAERGVKLFQDYNKGITKNEKSFNES